MQLKHEKHLKKDIHFVFSPEYEFDIEAKTEIGAWQAAEVELLQMLDQVRREISKLQDQP